MMMGGFNALKAMNDSIKQNRELLKKPKRKLNDSYRHGESSLKESEPVLSENERIKILQALKVERTKELKRKLTILVVAVIVTAILFYSIL